VYQSSPWFAHHETAAAGAVEALQSARARQEIEAFKQRYGRRAGIEGTISQGTHGFDLR